MKPGDIVTIKGVIQREDSGVITVMLLDGFGQALTVVHRDSVVFVEKKD